MMAARSGVVGREPKTHQERRLALDDATLELLAEYRDRCRERAGHGLPPARARDRPDATVVVPSFSSAGHACRHAPQRLIRADETCQATAIAMGLTYRIPARHRNLSGPRGFGFRRRSFLTP